MKTFIRISAAFLLIASLSGCAVWVGPGYGYGHYPHCGYHRCR
jgi:hypothetical protein